MILVAGPKRNGSPGGGAGFETQLNNEASLRTSATNLKRVFRDFSYRKHTKLQFARDDPAFLVLLSGWLVISTAGFAFVLGVGFFQFIKFLFYVIFVDCIGVGILIASLMWAISNKYMLKPTCQDLDVEWGYCFDVHLK